MQPKQEKEPRGTRIAVVLGGRMFESSSGGFVFPLVTEKSNVKPGDLPVEVSGMDSRMRAVQSLYQQHLEERPGQELLVFTTGGKEESGKSRSDEAAKKLVEKYGLPEESVKSLGGQGSTMGNAEAVMKFAEDNESDIGEVREIEIVTNDFHMLRAWLMFTFQASKHSTGEDLKIEEKDIVEIERILKESLEDPTAKSGREKVMAIIRPYLEGVNFGIKPVVVEDEIQSLGKGGKKYAEKILDNEWVKKTRELENKGVVDLLRGKYKK